jgi:hypothetical protein
LIVVPATDANAVATEGVVALRIWVQVEPPLVDWITPLPEMPA